MKPALLLGDASIEVNDFRPTAAAGVELLTIFLKLSQELNMNPGLLLPIAEVGTHQADATGHAPIVINNLWKSQGTLWVPRVVGLRQQEVGALTWDIDVHLDYEVVEVPWMDYFMMWEHLDNVVDNTRDY